MFIIGELINGMFKGVEKAVADHDSTVIEKLAAEQFAAGAQAIDLNVGPAAKDPVGDMCWLVEVAAAAAPEAILSIDSTKNDVVEGGLKAAKGKTMINSTSADVERLSSLLPLAKKYDSRLIGLTMDKAGVPGDRDKRLELAAAPPLAANDPGARISISTKALSNTLPTRT